MADVTLTVDGKKITAPAGTLLIEACKSAGIEVPSFCYYPGLSLQGACRMCLVKIEKMPKLQTACTTVVGEGMIVSTDSDEVRQARKAMVELLLGNHPLDCPVCDAGGECELQDMTFLLRRRRIEIHRGQEPSRRAAVVAGGVFRPPALHSVLSLRAQFAARAWTFGRWACRTAASSSIIAPNQDDHLECEECGMCIDICPVGALTSGRLSLQDASVGDEARGHDLHSLRGRLQDHAGRAPLRDRHGDRPRRQP